jgi:membrane complex biogenesis BtpA family protein
MIFNEIFHTSKPIIGMVHLPPLPLSPKWADEGYESILHCALQDAQALQQGGIDGIILENQNDLPFAPEEVPPVIIAYMAALGRDLRRQVDLPFGINILFNDWQAEIAVAAAVGASFIRVEVLVDPSWSDLGYLEACAPGLLRLMNMLHSDVRIFADVQGKYTVPCSPRSLTDSAQDAQNRGLADVVIITGSGTGHSASLEDVREVKKGISIPVLVGSGVTPQNLAGMLDAADGAIVGSFFKRNGELANSVDADRVRQIMEIARKVR